MMYSNDGFSHKPFFVHCVGQALHVGFAGLDGSRWATDPKKISPDGLQLRLQPLPSEACTALREEQEISESSGGDTHAGDTHAGSIEEKKKGCVVH